MSFLGAYNLTFTDIDIIVKATCKKIPYSTDDLYQWLWLKTLTNIRKFDPLRGANIKTYLTRKSRWDVQEWLSNQGKHQRRYILSDPTPTQSPWEAVESRLTLDSVKRKTTLSPTQEKALSAYLEARDYQNSKLVSNNFNPLNICISRLQRTATKRRFSHDTI